MKRIIVICEGQTEQEFVKTNLKTPFINNKIILYAPTIKQSKGGIVNWSVLKNQIETHLKSDPTSYVTTFIDYYGMYAKHEFPHWESAEKIVDKNLRMNELEKAMYEDIIEENRHRFIPYLQLHEFEGLLFIEKKIFHDQIPEEDIIGKAELQETFNNFTNPEMINSRREFSPSHRLKRIIKGYNKVVYGNILAEAIGLTKIRNKSPRFNAWLAKLESI